MFGDTPSGRFFRDAVPHARALPLNITGIGTGRTSPGRHTGAQRTVTGGGMNDEEADARATNAEPWEPPPGMLKRQCPECWYFFAAPRHRARSQIFCPDCASTRAPGRCCTTMAGPPRL